MNCGAGAIGVKCFSVRWFLNLFMQYIVGINCTVGFSKGIQEQKNIYIILWIIRTYVIVINYFLL